MKNIKTISSLIAILGGLIALDAYMRLDNWKARYDQLKQSYIEKGQEASMYSAIIGELYNEIDRRQDQLKAGCVSKD